MEIKMIGCEGGCSCTKPESEFHSELFWDAEQNRHWEVHTCLTCGGNGEDEPLNYDNELCMDMQTLRKEYRDTKRELDDIESQLRAKIKRYNENWNTQLTFKDEIER